MVGGSGGFGGGENGGIGMNLIACLLKHKTLKILTRQENKHSLCFL